MEVEVWVTCSLLAQHTHERMRGKHTRGGEEVRAGVSADGKMTSSVHTHKVVGKCVLPTLHVIPEGLHVRAVQKFDNHLIVGPLAGRPGRNVTLQAAGVVSKTTIGSIRSGEIDRVRGRAECVGEDGTKVDRPILEWTRRHATSASALGNLDQRLQIGRDTVERLVAAACITITAHRGIGAV